MYLPMVSQGFNAHSSDLWLSCVVIQMKQGFNGVTKFLIV